MNRLTLLPGTSSRSDNASTLEELASQIREYQNLHDAGRDNMLFGAVEMGKRLTLARKQLAHGKFGKWIKENFGFSHQWANILMRAADAAAAELETETWVSICGKYESVRHLAGARRSDTPPVPRQPRKARQTPEAEREVYEADVAAAAAEVIDTREIELLTMVGERDATIQQLSEEVQHLNEVKAAMLLELDDLRELLRAILKEADDNGGKLSTCTRMGNAPTTGPLTAEERAFISKVKAEFQARKAAAKPTRKKK